ncbi:MAG TPA: ATP-binding protein [Vicinamibacterales bacterium]
MTRRSSRRFPSEAALTLELPSATLQANLIALADASRDFVALVDADARLLFMNAAGRRYLGAPRVPARGARTLATYVSAESHRLPSTLVGAALRAGEPRESNVPFVHQQSGAVLLTACVFTPMAGNGPARSVAVVGHPVDEEDLDEDRPDFGGGVPARARMMELLTGVVGHDLRNPLNAIVTCAHFVARQSETPGIQTSMTRIISSGHRMQRMIDQLLDLTRLRVGGGIPLRPDAVDLAGLAEQAAQEIRTAHAGWAVGVTTAGDTAGTWDGDRVTQLLSNLLGNAVQHGSREAGVRVEIDGTAADTVTIHVWNAGTIPPDVLPLLFNPFRVVHQKRADAGGLGLGLYVTRQIARAHGGDVQAASDDGGTTFTVRLPRIAAAAVTADAAAEIAAMESFAAPPEATTVTAQLFGAAPLQERAPQQYWDLFERYLRVLDAARERQTYRGAGARVPDDLRAIADELASLGAGAREVAELHARALRQRTRAIALAKAQALTAEGRLVSFELMGHLLSCYRRRAGVGGREPRRG